MAYIGRQVTVGNYLKLDDISSQFNGTQTRFNLTTGGQPFYAGSSYALRVALGGVLQEPEAAYTIDENQIVFATAPASTAEFYCIVLGTSIGIGVPGENTVKGSKLTRPFNYEDGLLYLDDTTNRVGINTETPQADLHVVGVVSATSFYGDGSTLTNIISGVGIQSAGTVIGTGVTTLNFIGAGNTFAYNPATKTVNISISGGLGVITKQSFSVTSSQSVFTLTESYSPGLIDVFVNGIRLATGDFAETNATTITLTTPAKAGDVVEFQAYSIRVENTVLQSSLTNLRVTGITTLGSSNGIGTVTVGVGTTALLVDGNARITGTLAIGNSSIVFDGNNNTINVGSGVTITGTGQIQASSLSIGGAPAISSPGVGIRTAGGTVGTGITLIDLRGVGVSTVTASSGIATVNIIGGGGAGGAIVTSTAPPAPSDGQLWFDIDNGVSYIYYQSQSTWVSQQMFEY